MLNQQLIQNKIRKGSVTILQIVDSTNQYLINNLHTLHSGDVCIAECQQAGRGRYGHKWFSPFNSNLYFSMYWNFHYKLITTIGLSLMVSIVVAEVLHDFGVNQVRIKWPNDLYVFGRKLAGVLLEIFNKNNNIVQIIIGIGINLTMWFPHLKKDINRNWINLQEIGIDVDQNTVAVLLTNKLRISLKYFEKYGFSLFLPKWKKLDGLINCPVKLILNNEEEIYGISRGVNEWGALLIEQNGIIKPWMYGKISSFLQKDK